MEILRAQGEYEKLTQQVERWKCDVTVQQKIAECQAQLENAQSNSVESQTEYESDENVKREAVVRKIEQNISITADELKVLMITATELTQMQTVYENLKALDASGMLDIMAGALLKNDSCKYPCTHNTSIMILLRSVSNDLSVHYEGAQAILDNNTYFSVQNIEINTNKQYGQVRNLVRKILADMQCDTLTQDLSGHILNHELTRLTIIQDILSKLGHGDIRYDYMIDHIKTLLVKVQLTIENSMSIEVLRNEVAHAYGSMQDMNDKRVKRMNCDASVSDGTKLFIR